MLAHKPNHLMFRQGDTRASRLAGDVGFAQEVVRKQGRDTRRLERLSHAERVDKRALWIPVNRTRRPRPLLRHRGHRVYGQRATIQIGRE